ncbi:choice-of-anchor D domain-containing protein [Granulicella aggregans]|uniref:choice-of-anchor D domain-containing protein n=1 Tax=Granulicella aggregans TaxID=474949 RepID=UPI0021E02515|nr:choice-of-anchor D domain-containing protein [Granulicella aggregans]
MLVSGLGLGQEPTHAIKPHGWGTQHGRLEHGLRARRFLAGRESGAAGMELARRQQAAMLAEPRVTPLTTAWQPVGPMQVASLAYGKVTGRVTAIAIDPADASGNTVYVGTTGGGVWKSTNAAGAASAVKFVPLTDTLPVFSLNSGSATIASLSIGALSVGNGVILAGTGDTNDALDSYYGSGLLRSNDGGATWTLVQQADTAQGATSGIHSFVGLGFAGLAASPTVMVAAVGDAAEGKFVNAAETEYSVRGLYFSTDAGVSWQMATILDGMQTVQQPLPNGENVGGNAATAVVWNPLRQRFYAAVRFHGYYESADGATWTRLAAQPGAGLTVAACPANPGSVGSATCPIFRGALAVEPESGDTFAFTVDANYGDQGIWRDSCAAMGGVCSTSEIAFATKLNSGPLETGGAIGGQIFQGDYNLTLAAMASGSSTLLFAGTLDLYRCSLTTAATGAGGCVFRNTTNVEDGCAAPAMVAPGQHALAGLAGGALPLVFVGNDGGLWRSLDGVAQQGSPCAADDATHFDNLNGGLGSLAEVVQFSQHPTNADMLLVGLGANGTAATSTASDLSAWGQLADGEGGYSAIDPVSPAKWYASTAPGVSITYCSQGSACGPTEFDTQPTIGAPQVTQDASLIDPPWLLDPALSSNVLIGTCRVWRGPATQSTAWPATNVLSSEFGGPQNQACDGTNNFVRSLAAGGPAATATTAAGSGSTVLYAGMAGVLDGGGSVGGHVFATTDANAASSVTAWTDLAGSPVTNDGVGGGVFNAAGFDISSVAVDPHDATGMTVYATVMGFTGNGVTAAHAYRSTDGGAHWTNIGSNLPDAPANSIVVDPNDANTVYVAMDTGVFVTNQVTSCTSASCWSVYGSGLPNAPVVQLVASATTPAGGGTVGELRAATYGRGIWQIPLLTAGPGTNAAITLTPAALAFGTQAVGSASGAQTITVTNGGSAALVVSGVTATGDFPETDDCVGSSIAAGGSCAVQVVFSPTAVGAATGVLTISANVAGGQATAALTGTGAAAGAVVLTPPSVSFGTVTVGGTSASQNIVIANTGGVAVALYGETVAGDFQMATNHCGASLAAGASCTIGMTFAPTVAGIRNGTLSVVDSAGTQLASLTGVAASKATDTLSPTSLTFGAQMVGTTSAYQTVFLTNAGDTALTGISVAIGAGDFQVVNSCGATLSGHAACTMQVAFAPAAVGMRTGTLVVTDEFGQESVALTGTAVAVPTVALTPGSLTFPLTIVGARTDPQQILVTNAGAGQLTVASVSITGDFTETNSCINQSVTGPYSCGILVTFAPSAPGTRTGLITVTGTQPGQQAKAILTGTAVSPAAITLTPGSVDFGTLEVGKTSSAQSVSIANTGGVAATLQVPMVSGDYQLTANTCGAALAPGVGCTVSIVFAPTGRGARGGVLNVLDSVGDQQAALTGIGVTPATDSLSAQSLSFVPQLVGTSSAAQSVTLANAGDEPLTLVAAKVTSGPFSVTNNCGTSLSAQSSCMIAVVFSPTAAGAATGTLVVSDALRSQTIALLGSAFAPPGVGLPTGPVAFPVTVIGQSSLQTVTVSNAGGGTLVVGSVTTTPGTFAETDNCIGAALSGAATCSVQVRFSPLSAGALQGALTVSGTGNVTGQPPNPATSTVGLTGTGAEPAKIVLTPAGLSFGAVTLGQTSAAQNVTISNTGGVSAALTSVSVTGDFITTANTCAQTLGPQAGCTVSVVFTPKASGTRTGTLSVTDSVGVQTASLTGTGASPATDTLSPLALSFGTQTVGTASAAQAVTLTNSGDEALTLIATTVSNSNFTAVNQCGPMLAGHSSCAIQVTLTPMVNGSVMATLTVSDQFRSQTVALSGTGYEPPTVALTPGMLTFPATVIGGSSAAQTVMITNSGVGQIAVGKVAITGDFVETDGCAGKVLSGSASCSVTVVFDPTAAGVRQGVLTVTGVAAGQVATAILQGTGATPAAIVLNPASTNFGTVTLGSASMAQNVTISNTGGVAATLQGVSISGDFTVSTNTCESSLASQTGCTVGIVFTPTVSGKRTGVLTVTDSVGTQTAALTGVGASAATDGLSPLALTFAPQQLNTTSAAQVVTLTNTGDNALTLISALVTSGDFAASSACGSSLIGHASCAISVVSVPKSVGPGSGTLTVSDEFRTQTVALNGTGVAPPGVTLSPLAGLTFGATGVTTVSAPQAMTLANNGGSPLVVAGIVVTGDFNVPAAKNACTATVAPGGSCAFQVVFAPTVGGARTGTVSAMTNAPGPAPVVPLAGMGVDFSLAVNGATSVTVSSGGAAVFPLLLSSAAGIPGTATLACTGAPANATCVVTPGSAGLGGSTTISVTVDTGVTVASSAWSSRSGVWWVMVLPVVLPFRRLRFRGLLLFVGLIVLAGCGSGRLIPPPGGGGGGGGSPVTPSGTYSIVVSGTSAGLTRSVTLTLVVQ